MLAIGAVVHRPLSRVPENTIKYGVGILLTTFGTFWAVEGLGVFAAEGESLEWPGGELALARRARSAGSSSRGPRRQPPSARAGGRRDLRRGATVRFSSPSAGSGTTSSSATTGGSPPASSVVLAVGAVVLAVGRGGAWLPAAIAVALIVVFSIPVLRAGRSG